MSGTFEMLLGHSLRSVDTIPHLDGVEIDLEDAFLTPENFYQGREVNFKAFS